jgi:hypothetical protein
VIRIIEYIGEDVQPLYIVAATHCGNARAVVSFKRRTVLLTLVSPPTGTRLNAVSLAEPSRRARYPRAAYNPVARQVRTD